LQKMFPKNGAKVPELRFSGFADAWEQRKLTEIVNRVNKSSNSDVLPKVEFEDIVSREGRLNKDISSKLDSRKGTLFESENILYCVQRSIDLRRGVMCSFALCSSSSMYFLE